MLLMLLLLLLLLLLLHLLLLRLLLPMRLVLKSLPQHPPLAATLHMPACSVM